MNTNRHERISRFRLPIVGGLLPIIGVLAVVCWLPAREIESIVESAPIEAKPVLITQPEAWIIRNDTGLHIVGYYCRVKMPDGSTQQMKIKPAPTAKPTDALPVTSEWQTLANKQWEAMKLAELNKPMPCTHCGGTGVEP